MDSEARAHVVDGQKQPGGLFLGRGLIPSIGVALGKKRGTHLQQQVLFVLVGDIERGLCSRCSLKVFFDAQGASFCFAKTENSAEDLYKRKRLVLEMKREKPMQQQVPSECEIKSELLSYPSITSNSIITANPRTIPIVAK